MEKKQVIIDNLNAARLDGYAQYFAEVTNNLRIAKDERKKYLKATEILTMVVLTFINKFDAIMKEPSTEARGKKLAQLVGRFLELENDRILHFTLGYPFEKINKIKGRSPSGEDKDK